MNGIMETFWYWLLPLGLTLLGLVLWGFWRVGRTHDPTAVALRSREKFRQQREHLEADFFAAAAKSGKPRGLRWVECDFGDAIEFVREKTTGMLVAFVGVTIRFEAVEGGDMEGLPAVGNLRTASAVFTYHGDRWHTAGRALFNLNPDEAAEHFGSQYEKLAADGRGGDTERGRQGD